MKTLSDHPLLIGRILARVNGRKVRADRRRGICRTFDDLMHRRGTTVALLLILLALLALLIREIL